MAHCNICNQKIGFFGKKYTYANIEGKNKPICKECYEESKIEDEDKRDDLIVMYGEKINYFLKKEQIGYAKTYGKKRFLLDNEDFVALNLLALIYFNECQDTERIASLSEDNVEEAKEIREELENKTLEYIKKLIKIYPDDIEALNIAEMVFEKLGYHEDAADCALRKSHLESEESKEHESEDFKEQVKNKCNMKTNKGILVQSKGEKLIADFLCLHKIDFDYDEQITLKGNEKNKDGYLKSWIRPDFYLTEFDIIIEYWGLKGIPDYDEKMQNKKRLYKEANKKFISITPENLSTLDNTLKVKLERLGCSIK